jgi:hypothetical protein
MQMLFPPGDVGLKKLFPTVRVCHLGPVFGPPDKFQEGRKKQGFVSCRRCRRRFETSVANLPRPLQCTAPHQTGITSGQWTSAPLSPARTRSPRRVRAHVPASVAYFVARTQVTVIYQVLAFIWDDQNVQHALNRLRLKQGRQP